uniref:Saposin B-type domain-containing protein n=1 Tax=Rhabditophanes sp. KR3021 TaxID=114890 RepID=A0AC35U822_9BILA
MFKFIIVLAICILFITKASADPTECGICSRIMIAAENNFKNGEPESTLLTDLTADCYSIAGFYGPSAISTCLQIINGSIDNIYKHFQAGMKPCDICKLAQSCTAADTCP